MTRGSSLIMKKQNIIRYSLSSSCDVPLENANYLKSTSLEYLYVSSRPICADFDITTINPRQMT